MKSTWATRPLGEIVEVLDSRRKPITKRNRVTGPYPYYGATGIVDHVAEYIFDENLLLLGEDGAKWGACEECAFQISGKCWVNNHAHVLRPRADLVSGSWLEYFLNGSDLSSFVFGMTVPKLNQGEMNRIPIPLPSKAEQERIVAILDQAFDAIDFLQEQAMRLGAAAQEFFASYRAEVFDQDDGWTTLRLTDIAVNLDARRVPITRSDRNSGEYPYYGASGVVDFVGDFIFEGRTLLISEDGANLLARVTPIAFTADGKYWVNNHAHVLKFEELATHQFVEYYLESISLKSFVTGAAQPKLTQKALNSIPIRMPVSVSMQTEIVSKLERVSDECNSIKALSDGKLDLIKALRKSLLHQAFSGNL